MVKIWRGSKASNSAQAHLERRGARRRSAITVADAFPGVRSVSIRLSFTGASDAPHPRDVQLLHSPLSRAFFEFKCQNWRCELGGYDLGPVVESCVNDKRKKATGTMRCQGWCDANHETDRCPWSLRYEIQLS